VALANPGERRLRGRIREELAWTVYVEGEIGWSSGSNFNSQQPIKKKKRHNNQHVGNAKKTPITKLLCLFIILLLFLLLIILPSILFIYFPNGRNMIQSPRKENNNMISIPDTPLKVQNLRKNKGTRRITVIAGRSSSLDDEWQMVDGTNIVLIGGRETVDGLREYMLTPMAARRFPGGIGGGAEQVLRQWLGIKRSGPGRPPVKS
jgi:hypothetical protein